MANPWVREIGAVVDIDGARLAVGVDYSAVTIAGHKLTAGLAEEFARLFTAACWQAAAQGEHRNALELDAKGQVWAVHRSE